MHLTALPLELVQNVVEGVGKLDLVNLRLVSKSLNSVITPIAFRVVTVTDSVKSAEAVSFLQDSDGSVTSVVHEVVFTSRVYDFWALDELDEVEAASKEVERHALSLVFSGLIKFCNLRRLRLNFHDKYEEESDPQDHSEWTHYLHLQNDIFTAIASNPPPPLISLTLVNVIAVPTGIYAEERFQLLFRSLHELHIDILSNADLEGGHCDEPLGEFWAKQCVPSIIRGATAIKSLTIISDQAVGGQPTMSLDDIFLPHLSSLVLHQLFHRGVVDFVLRHKATLARLELHECSMDGGGLYDMLAPEGGFGSVFPQPWHAVFASFEAELGVLRHFAFFPTEFRYSWEDPGFGYVPWDEAAEAVGQGDEPALKSLMAVVESRRG
ncbi:hypothetical protein K438DRAFT_490960 [Mycena galopus ATCC 62051]|nr:hypothetical protein K438DRAFT_490960 [Mycena galopus ATCC 62051]